MQTREEIQESGVNLLLSNKRVLLSWSTGVGKSRPAIQIIDRLPDDAKVLLLISERLHKVNWKDEFIKLGKEKLLSKVTMACYASLHKYKDTNWDFIIMDEVHHTRSSLRIAALKTINAEYIIGLSATINKKLVESLNSIFGTFTVSTVNLQNAIDNNILPEPTIYLIPLRLNNRVCSEEIIEEWGSKKSAIEYWTNYGQRWKFIMNKKAYPNVKLHIACTQQQKYSFLCDKVNFYKNLHFRKKTPATENLWLQWGAKRKLFLGMLKTSIVKNFLKREVVDNKKYICFCSNIEQVEDIGKQNAIHSKKLNCDQIVKEFNEGKRKHLFAVEMAVEGLNLSGIEAGIIVQLDGETLKFYQKFGRTTRAKNPVQYIFYYKNTRDEEYLKKALEGIDPKYIKEIKDYENIN